MKKFLQIFMLTAPLLLSGQNDKASMDWPDLARYRTENTSVMLQPAANSNRVILMGDSITEFWKTTDEVFFKGKNYHDRGISGQTTSQMLLRFRQDVVQLKPDVVVLLAGTNDVAGNTGPIALSGIMDNIISMVELAKMNKIKVVLCSVLPANRFWWNPEMQPADKLIALNALLKEYAQKNSITYVDYYSSMVDNQKGLDKKWADDGVHPNLAGYQLMEPLLEKGIAEALRK